MEVRVSVYSKKLSGMRNTPQRYIRTMVTLELFNGMTRNIEGQSPIERIDI